MSEVNKSFVAATGIVLASIAVYGGTLSRDRVEGIVLKGNGHQVQEMVASRDDAEIPEGDYFYELTRLVKREFVEPVNDEQKLASGAVKGMIASLGDPKSLFLDGKEFKAYLGQRQGRYEGVGADLELLLPGKAGKDAQDALQPTDGDTSIASAASRIPKLVVMGITPGGPADKAGVKLGDYVVSIDGHWVVSADLRKEFMVAQRQFLANKMDANHYNAIRKDVLAKSSRALLPLRAWDRLSEGTSGAIDVVWDRSGTQRETKLEKSTSSMPQFSASGSVITLPFTTSSVSNLRKAIAGKASVTINLRNNVLGDFGIMKDCLAVLAPAGEYGKIYSVHSPRGVALAVKSGNSHPPKITLEVDSGTRGVAQIFALALSSRHRATLSGSEMGGDLSVRQVVQLPDGSGYTLRTGSYEPLASAMDVKTSKKGKA